MHLMYTTGENGARIYTLKVCIYPPNTTFHYSTCVQKVTAGGEITKSAHPGSRYKRIMLVVNTDLSAPP